MIEGLLRSNLSVVTREPRLPAAPRLKLPLLLLLFLGPGLLPLPGPSLLLLCLSLSLPLLSLPSLLLLFPEPGLFPLLSLSLLFRLSSLAFFRFPLPHVIQRSLTRLFPHRVVAPAVVFCVRPDIVVATAAGVVSPGVSLRLVVPAAAFRVRPDVSPRVVAPPPCRPTSSSSFVVRPGVSPRVVVPAAAFRVRPDIFVTTLADLSSAQASPRASSSQPPPSASAQTSSLRTPARAAFAPDPNGRPSREPLPVENVAPGYVLLPAGLVDCQSCARVGRGGATGIASAPAKYARNLLLGKFDSPLNARLGRSNLAQDVAHTTHGAGVASNLRRRRQNLCCMSSVRLFVASHMVAPTALSRCSTASPRVFLVGATQSSDAEQPA